MLQEVARSYFTRISHTDAQRITGQQACAYITAGWSVPGTVQVTASGNACLSGVRSEEEALILLHEFIARYQVPTAPLVLANLLYSGDLGKTVSLRQLQRRHRHGTMDSNCMYYSVITNTGARAAIWKNGKVVVDNCRNKGDADDALLVVTALLA